MLMSLNRKPQAITLAICEECQANPHFHLVHRMETGGMQESFYCSHRKNALLIDDRRDDYELQTELSSEQYEQAFQVATRVMKSVSAKIN